MLDGRNHTLRFFTLVAFAIPRYSPQPDFNDNPVLLTLKSSTATSEG